MFKNKLIVLSGGMKGLGEALAKVLNNNFATVVVTSRNIDFNPNKIQIGSINAQNLDVTNEASIDRFFSWLSQQEIPLSAFINNAGIGVFKEFIELSILEIKSVIDTNLTGAFMCSQHAVKIMKEQNYGGRIIHIGSIVELGGLQLNSIYAATKAGIRAMSLVISEEYYKYNITSTHIALGAVHSDIWNSREGFKTSDMLNINDVANTITHLISLPFNIRIDYFEITPPKKIL